MGLTLLGDGLIEFQRGMKTNKEIDEFVNSPDLDTLDLRTKLRENYHPEMVAEKLAQIDHLKFLDISYNDLNNNAPAMAEHLATAPLLKSINMSGNKLATHGPETAEKLAKSKSLLVVKMENNQLQEEDAVKIAKSFAYRDNPVKLGIDGEFHQPISKAIAQDNKEMRTAFKEAIPQEGKSLDCPELLDLIGGYADFFADFYEDPVTKGIKEFNDEIHTAIAEVMTDIFDQVPQEGNSLNCPELLDLIGGYADFSIGF